MHGKVDTIANLGGTLFSGIEAEFQATRYHSLAVDVSGPQFRVNARSKTDGEIMAIEDTSLRLFGLQFHPESYATPSGAAIIENFVEVCHGVS